jgi:hypothetical protein
VEKTDKKTTDSKDVHEAKANKEHDFFGGLDDSNGKVE